MFENNTMKNGNEPPACIGWFYSSYGHAFRLVRGADQTSIDSSPSKSPDTSFRLAKYFSLDVSGRIAIVHFYYLCSILFQPYTLLAKGTCNLFLRPARSLPYCKDPATYMKLGQNTHLQHSITRRHQKLVAVLCLLSKGMSPSTLAA